MSGGRPLGSGALFVTLDEGRPGRGGQVPRLFISAALDLQLGRPSALTVAPTLDLSLSASQPRKVMRPGYGMPRVSLPRPMFIKLGLAPGRYNAVVVDGRACVIDASVVVWLAPAAMPS